MQRIPIFEAHGKVFVTYTIVDDQDFEWLSKDGWHLSAGGYVINNRTQERMSRVLLGLPPGDPREADHIDRDKLNHKRANLRIVTRAEGNQNRGKFRTWKGQPTTSIHRGVTFHKLTNKWQAYAQVNGRRTYLGLFETEDEAAEAVQNFRRQHLPFATD